MPLNPAQLVGLAALATSCGVALWRGGRAERLAALIIIAAWFVTPLVERRGSWLEPQYGVLAVDSLTLAALAAITLAYRRVWALYAAGFQSVAVLTHIAFLADPPALYRAYLYVNFSIGFLLLGALLGGVLFETAPPARLIRRLQRLGVLRATPGP